MIVIDASVLVNAIAMQDASGDAARRELRRDRGWRSVPHVHAETLSAIRRLEFSGRLVTREADRAAHSLRGAEVTLLRGARLLERMWALRHNLTAYDAAYVAAAELLDCPLVTADARLAAAPGLHCEVRLAA